MGEIDEIVINWYIDIVKLAYRDIVTSQLCRLKGLAVFLRLHREGDAKKTIAIAAHTPLGVLKVAVRTDRAAVRTAGSVGERVQRSGEGVDFAAHFQT